MAGNRAIGPDHISNELWRDQQLMKKLKEKVLTLEKENKFLRNELEAIAEYGDEFGRTARAALKKVE